MNILVICSALNNSYLAIEYKNDIYSEIIKSDENYHSLYLISKIKEICDKKNIKLKDFDLIGVNLGPGSFTGIRTALSVAKIISGELNLPLVGLKTNEILLCAFDKKILLMDARQDMYYYATKDNIKLIYSNKLENIDPKETICDKRINKIIPEIPCFEDIEKDLGLTMLKLAKEKYLNTENKDEFNYLNIQANYIQTPNIFHSC